ncbi:MAG: ABC transporter substrate-binding protein [Salinisphaera sp.]|nr:ABC transporter substrate-binding protein [Salinisphaera sp.]
MRSSKLNRPLLAAAALATGVYCVAGALPDARAADAIAVGVIAPKSHILGQAIFHAAELSVAQFNARGGVNGRKIELQEYNTNFSAADSARAFQRAVQSDGVVAMVGVFTSEVALSLMPWSSRLKTPLIITGAASSQIPERVHAQPERFKYVFHGYVNSAILARQGCIVAHDVFTNNPRLKKYDRAVIFSEDAAWTKPVDAAYQKCLPKAGMKVVDHIRFAPDTSDFTPIYSRIKNDHANVIMAAIAHVGVKPVVQWHQQQIPALFSGINGQAGSSKFWDATNGATEGVITGTPGLAGAPLTDKSAAFYAAYKKRFHVDEPAYDAYTTFDAMSALEDALGKAPNTSGDALVKALEQTDITGVLGRVAFHGLNDKDAHEVVFNEDPKKGQSFVGFQWQHGKQVIIWPPKLATGHVVVPSFVAAGH